MLLGRLNKSFLSKFFLLFVACLVIFGYLSWYSKINSFEQLFALFRFDNNYLWAVYILSFALANFLRSMRWRYLLSRHLKLGILEAWLNFQWLFMLKVFTPMKSGEVFRALWLKSEGGSGSYGLGILIIEKLFDITMLFGFTVFAMMLFVDLKGVIVLNYYIIVLLFAAVSLLVLNLSRIIPLSWATRFLSKYSLLSRVIIPRLSMIEQLYKDDMTLSRRSVVLLFTIGIWLSLLAGVNFVMHSIYPDFHMTASIAIIVATNMAGFISPIPGNIGSYQIAAATILQVYGVPLADGITFALALQLVMLSTVVFLGITGFVGIKFTNKRICSSMEH